ncbi:MAG: NAD-dependent deacylase [Alphaproteobacteria bacterium]|nr:NAD-dependent deacylase [Alphaproteobacteria bacterium]MBO5441977.1 NAD-dependent deacylase [Alphaproteobacteria bacterium]
MEYQNIVFLTGAGISAPSGLQTFRGENGLWYNRNPEDVATLKAFEDNPLFVLRFYNRLRKEMLQAEPNAAHLAIAKLQKAVADSRQGSVNILTQNIDTLHEKANSSQVLHIHGSIASARCTKCNCTWRNERSIVSMTLCPACKSCGKVRPDIVFFEEPIRHELWIQRILQAADLFIAVGTSGKIAPASHFAAEAKAHGAKTMAFNLEEPENKQDFDEIILGSAEQTLPQFIKELLSN